MTDTRCEFENRLGSLKRGKQQETHFNLLYRNIFLQDLSFCVSSNFFFFLSLNNLYLFLLTISLSISIPSAFVSYTLITEFEDEKNKNKNCF